MRKTKILFVITVLHFLIEFLSICAQLLVEDKYGFTCMSFPSIFTYFPSSYAKLLTKWRKLSSHQHFFYANWLIVQKINFNILCFFHFLVNLRSPLLFSWIRILFYVFFSLFLIELWFFFLFLVKLFSFL